MAGVGENVREKKKGKIRKNKRRGLRDEKRKKNVPNSN